LQGTTVNSLPTTGASGSGRTTAYAALLLLLGLGVAILGRAHDRRKSAAND
jgi:MYXO-CTERM domain-containing protein